MIELAGIIILGILAQWVAWRTKVPAILPLILIGLLVGPISSLFTEDGSKWLEPIYTNSHPTGLFPGQYLFYFVSLAIGLILFEGGLTLKRKEIQGVGPVILRLIFLGSLVTLIGVALATHFIMEINWLISFLFAALIIVTGPTVIAPILQNVPLNRNVATVLKWEGILIDPIGALTAVLAYEFIISGEGTLAFTSHAFLSFVRIVLIGTALGAISAWILFQLIKRDLIPHYLLNVFTLAWVLGIFVFSDVLAHESGLLTVVVMGMVLGNLDVPNLKEILYFKESLSVLLISILFILLAANINIDELELIFNLKCLGLFGIIILLVRPLGVLLSTYKSELNLKEKLFISWVGPRGIVAAGIASLFGIRLLNNDFPQAEYITPLVFMVVMGTVLLNASTARIVAKLLGVTQETADGILLIGANAAARAIGKYLSDHGRYVVLVDSNKSNFKKAKEMGMEAIEANVFSDELDGRFELLDVGYMYALTGSASVNEYVCKKFRKVYGENGTFRLKTSDELKNGVEEAGTDVHFFVPTDDYLRINAVAQDYPKFTELPIHSKEQFLDLVAKIDHAPHSIPVFLKNGKEKVTLIPGNYESVEIEKDSKLVYMGKPLDLVAAAKPKERDLTPA